ncbi:glycosyltransferase [Roseomonas eburnea]|uniref:Glycosyltransferase n=1 Tax=Neoroseomonas eburnea TaxID=1346889 RepID=A0A9X9XDD9_9PROT|nr:glycoside hydrolase family 99-like domain-containing protein [Neoroseomonas eburnea]MBR0681725.1 glycosyltransferase [Neoroseomonas eburnea]
MTDFFALLEKRRVEAGPPPPAPPRHDAGPAPLSGEALRAAYMASLARTGLFDADFYLATYPDIAAAGIEPFEHFYDHGYREGRRPNPYFDPLWYLGQHPDVVAGGLNPLLHYALHGDAEGRKPGPLFDPGWYRTRYSLPAGELALAHWLRHRASGRYSPMPEFDVDYYLGRNPDVAAAGVDPFEHFWCQGYKEGRNPSAEFDVRFYAQRYLRGDLSENPFAHWLAHRNEAGVYGRMPDDEATVPREVRRFTRPGPDFEEFRPLPADAPRRVKLLAYYLPQFHAFEQNDAWWGRGFTEWTNVPRGLPRFKGHYQPRVPRDLGFYTLQGDETFRRQVEMAKAGGVHGFVFYWYWFNGTRLMEKPVERFLADPSIDMPFCLMWANENWTRRWDGAESEVLISQDYRPDDDERMVAEFARHFRDARYIRVGGRPVLMVYRPALIPETKATIARWRHLFREQHGEDPLLVMAQGFGDTDPRPYGLDGAIEFPPHKLTQDLQPIATGLDILDPDFTGKVHQYESVVRVSLEEPAPPYPLIRTAVPSWDNDARRQGNGLVITGSTPAKYEAWLAALIEHAAQHPFHGESIVCVNAWNEWCEGAYLEPDLHFGSAYLNATGRAVSGATRRGQDTPPRLLLVGHDAFPGGAQQLLLSIGTTLRRAFGVEIEFLLLGGGAMEAAYRRVAPTTVVAGEAALAARAGALAARGFGHAIVNTTAAGHAVAALKSAGVSSVLLVHELPRLIREKHLADPARAGIAAARRVVFPAPFVRDEVLGLLGLPEDERVLLRHQGIYKNLAAAPGAEAAIRAELGMAPEDRLVLGMGYADMRKGFDLFLQLWRLLRWRGRRRVHLCWLGAMDPGMQGWLAEEIAAARATGTFHMPGHREDVGAFLRAADAYALTSREDPFPSVALEALASGVGVVAFERSGGVPDLLSETGVGAVVPYGDVTAMAEALATMVRGERDDPGHRRDAATRQRLAASRFGWRPYVRDLLHLAVPDLPSVSVAVPNYNYARFMPERLGSVFRQSLPVREVIVLDDCSTDDSLQVIPAVAARHGRDTRFEPNTVNSGSVFAQWRKAASLAQGEFLWIAEADDLSDPDFLLRAVSQLKSDPAIRFAFTDSSTIHADGTPMWPDYKQYYATLEPGALARSEVFEAADFVRRFLAVKNLILNVSAVVWRRGALLEALEQCGDALAGFRMAGDWRLYLQALAAPGARVAYEAAPLNVHRRHAQSVTHALDAGRHVEEIARCHAFAREAFAEAARAAAAQQSYLAEVAAQLGLAPASPAGKRRRTRRSKSRAV